MVIAPRASGFVSLSSRLDSEQSEPFVDAKGFFAVRCPQ
jgi:hypothetical protein